MSDTPPKTPVTVPIYAGSPIITAYDAWLDHGKKCPECTSAGTAAASRCQAGKNAWAVYVDARDEAEAAASPPPPATDG